MSLLNSITSFSGKPEYYRQSVPFAIFFSLPALFPQPQSLAALFFLCLALLPIFHTVFISKRLDFFEPLLVISVMYVFMAPLPILLPYLYVDRVWEILSKDDLEQALLWTYRGFACFFLTYLGVTNYLSRSQTTNKVSPPSFQDSVRISLWLGILAIIGAMTMLIQFQGATYVFVEVTTEKQSTGGQIIWYMMQLGYAYVLVYLFLRSYSVQEKRLEWLFYALLSLHLLIIIGAGSKGKLISFFVAGGLALSLSNKKFSAKPLFYGVLMLLLVYFTFSVITNYRQVILSSNIPNQASIVENFEFQGSMFLEAITRSIEEQTSETTQLEGSFQVTQSAILDRLAYMASFANLLQFSGGQPPYENAVESMLLPIYALTPRSLIPDKPHFFDSGDLARTVFGWKFGGIAVTLIGSLYWAWGYIGICLGMSLVGFLLATVKVKASYFSPQGTIYKIILLFLTLGLMDAGTIFQAIFLDSTRLWVAMQLLYIFVRLTKKKWRFIPSSNKFAMYKGN